MDVLITVVSLQSLGQTREGDALKKKKKIHWVFFSLSPNEIQGCGRACLYVHAYISLLKPFFQR